MKIVRNKFIPFKGFRAINILGVLFVHNDAYIDEKTINHEMIHTAQMKELLYIFFYVLYLIEWLLRLAICRNFKKAYRNICFEKEAYENEGNLHYLSSRSCWAWIF